MKERDLHKAVAQFLALALPKNAVWTTFPAGGGGTVRGAQLKARGLMAGWPDVQILWDGLFYGVELKAAHGRLSPEQRACGEAIAAAGGYYKIIRSLEELQDWFPRVGIPLRASTGPAAKPGRKRGRAA